MSAVLKHAYAVLEHVIAVLDDAYALLEYSYVVLEQGAVTFYEGISSEISLVLMAERSRVLVYYECAEVCL